MKYLLISLIYSVFLSQASLAGNTNENTCDGSKRHECLSLVVSYSYGIPPFPNDTERAESLQNIALQGARAGCVAGDYTDCFRVKDMYFMPANDNPTSDNQKEEALAFYKEKTEEGCAAGSSDACYWRSIIYQDFDLRMTILLKAQEAGKDTVKITYDLEDDIQLFKGKMLNAAIIEAERFRSECLAGNARTCGQLGVLIKDRELPSNTPFEEIDMLITGCTVTRDANICNDAYYAITVLGVSKPSQGTELPIKEKAKQHLIRLCDAENGSACRIMAELNNDKAQRHHYNDLACQLDHGKACQDIGKAHYSTYRKSEDTDDLELATVYLTHACNLSQAYACHMLEHLSKG